MNPFQKVRAVKALLDNALAFSKLPDKVKEEVDDLNDDLTQLQKYSKALVENENEWKAKAKLV